MRTKISQWRCILQSTRQSFSHGSLCGRNCSHVQAQGHIGPHTDHRLPFEHVPCSEAGVSSPAAVSEAGPHSERSRLRQRTARRQRRLQVRTSPSGTGSARAQHRMKLQNILLEHAQLAYAGCLVLVLVTEVLRRVDPHRIKFRQWDDTCSGVAMNDALTLKTLRRPNM